MAQGVRWVWIGAAVLLALALAAPWYVYPVVVMEALCFALFACAFNLLIGYVGLLSFGHAAFFGSAAYITAHAVKVWGLPPELGILAGVAVVAIQVPFTHGEDGIQAVPRGRLFGVFDLDDTLAMYYFVLAVFLLGFALIVRTINSPFGQVIKAIRENEPRALSLGYHVDHYKLVVFILSAALSGLAGSVKSLVFQLATLTDVEWTMSGWVVLMTLVGGLGTVLGPV